MKYMLSIAFLLVAQVTLQAQTYEELIEFVKEEGYETT
jgi:lipocalin